MHWQREEYGKLYSCIDNDLTCGLVFTCGYNNKVPVVFEDTEEEDTPSSNQIFSLNFIEENLHKIAENIKLYIYNNREILIEIFGEYDPLLKIGFPLLSSSEDIIDFFTLDKIVVKTNNFENDALFSLIGKCSWDTEHDLGIVMLNENVMAFGDYDTATMFNIEDLAKPISLSTQYGINLNIAEALNSNISIEVPASDYNDYQIIFEWLVKKRALFGFRCTEYSLNINQKINVLLTIDKLDLSGKAFNELPEQINLLINLKKLILRKNYLTKFPSIIAQLDSLEYLDLSFNEIDEIPESICNLKNLKYLIIDHNKINIIPDCFMNVAKLEWLHCSNNRITQYPEFINNHPSISDFRIEENPINQNSSNAAGNLLNKVVNLITDYLKNRT